MKMPEKHDLLAAILAAKEQGIGAILPTFAMAYIAADIMAVRLQKLVIDTLDVRRYRLNSFVTFSTSPD